MQSSICALLVFTLALISMGSSAAALENSRTSASPRSRTESKVVVSNDERIYVEIARGKSAQAVFVLFNGLVYDMRRWDPLADALARQGHTVIRYAFRGQPENLSLLKKGEDPKFFQSGLELSTLAEDLDVVLEKLGVTQKVHLVGLSYGASVAAEYAVAHPDKVESTIFISPLVIPLDYYDPNGRGLRVWLGSVRFWENAPCDFYGAVNPWLCIARDYWYDSFYNYLYENYLFQRVQAAPEGIDATTYKKSIFHLVRAVRDFDLRGYASRLSDVHLFVASKDDKALLADQLQAWDEVAKDERRSLWVFEGAEHALPDQAPLRAAEALGAIARKSPETQSGKRLSVKADR